MKDTTKQHPHHPHPQPLSPFMNAVVSGDRNKIETMMAQVLAGKRAVRDAPVRGEGFVLVKDKGEG